MSGPSLNVGKLPPRSLFKFPPDPHPPAVPPPFEEHSFKTPFAISSETYNKVFNPTVPLTIASAYATTVWLLNAYNRRHGNQPWRISKTRIFYAFVILHNVALAVYSGVTCVAMIRALKHAIPHYTGENSLVGAVDALCKMHGPRGLGDAVTFNSGNSLWEVKNTLIKLTSSGLPDSTDLGRIWNEGLAFWGWFFYLSKFYEVFDTLIILAKGKRSTTLQTYHHAGAMLCMWAGMRFMSPPIWMFVLVNSGIHTMMYTYYTISALGFRVPQAIKRTLTTLQILQFIVGVSFAGAHLFVSYTIPVSIPYLSSTPISIATSAISSASSTVSAALSSSINTPEVATATAGAAALLKKLVLRAAGEEGFAENIADSSAQAFQAVEGIAQQVIQEPQQILQSAADKVVFRTIYQEIPCIDTTGQSFAIWLNLIYLFPLTGLFMRFFVKSYLRRTATGTKHPTKKRTLSKSGRDAANGVTREIESLGKVAEDGLNDALEQANNKRGRDRKAGTERVGSLSPAERDQQVKDSFNRRLSESLEKANLDRKSTQEAAKEAAREVISRASTPKSKRTLSGVATPESQTSNHSGGKSLAERLAEVKDEKENEAGGSADANGHLNGGLSSTNPKDEGVPYADMVKKS